MSDFYPDLANEMGSIDRYVQPDEEDFMDSKVHFSIPRRPPVTEEWLVRQAAMEDVRRAATRGMKWSEFRHACKFMAVFLALLAVSLSIWWGAVSLIRWLVWR